MKKRTRKILSLLLAASMVFSMNTIAFAEEIVTDDAAEIAAGEISDSGYVETADEAGADEESTADAGSGDASLAGQP
nr:hypothetical protein [Lachnospiraceae bacterium]